MTVVSALIIALLTLTVALAIAFYIIMRCVNEIIFLREDLQQESDATHTKCMGAVMKFVGDEYAAQVLTVAAEDYASVDAQADKDRIGRLMWREDGDPVPSLWLRERADRLRIMNDDVRDAIEHVKDMNYNEVAY